MKKIIDRLYYVGANDRTTHRFEAQWPLPLGVSYNSYFVKGSTKTALIDAIELSEIEILQENIREIIGTDAPDYLIINHMEPDHSGSMAALHRIFPNMVFVGNSKTLDMLKGFYGVTGERTLAIDENSTLDLGDLTLTFRLIPMVHWPETMTTYCPEMKVLFSGDAFGCFGALNGAVVDKDMDIEPYIPEMYRYYSNIVGKYGPFVQKAIAKHADVPIEYVCTTHGPVWHEQINRVVGIYDRLSRYEGETGVTIVYGSMYGNTERMAEAVASRLAERGIKQIRIHNAAHSHLSYILADIFRFNGLVIGAPTYSNSLFPPVENVLMAIKNRELKNRIVGTFGTHSWAPAGLKRITAMLDECKLLNPEVPAAQGKHAPNETVLQQCRDLADAMADKLLAAK